MRRKLKNLSSHYPSYYRTCSVCGIEKSIISTEGDKNFGDGISIPKATCLECYKKRQEKNKQAKTEKDKEKAENKEGKRVDPITQYLEELKNGK